ncbi:MAG TPA: MBL fold metallo-hydrolase [Acidimicrobiales bacterium]|nr:MBL fold metallo-hydrolase [Acidimicrobiales bacterium]
MTLRVGDVEIVPLVDGTCRLPQDFYVNLDFAAHPGLVADDGRVHVPIGCYLLRTGDRTVLLDAGMGPRRTSWGEGGDLPAQLAAVGVQPSDVDTVVCTHLHLDHAGWLVQDDRPYFPRATVRFGIGDREHFADDPVVGPAVRVLEDAGRVEPIEGDDVALAPGLTARHTPGHTPGHYGLVVSSGEQRAVILGDAVECPLQVEEADLYVMSDVDPVLARRTREAMWRELEGTDTLVGAAHFPGLRFGRILGAAGRRWFA